MWPNLQQRNILYGLHTFSANRAELWIQIRKDLHSFSLPDPHTHQYGDPDPRSKIWRQKQKKCKEIEVNVILFFKLSKFGPAPWFLTFKLSFLFFSTVHLVILYKFV